MLAGGVCGIFGFGGIGAATGRLMRGIGMRVHANAKSSRGKKIVVVSGTCVNMPVYDFAQNGEMQH